ncbi:MAG: hypothetical protein GY940_29005 [bacterium]|nr:hypothetical protein [bacterium]
MNKLFVVDTDDEFREQVRSLSAPESVDLQFFATSMEIFSLMETEKPQLIFLSLDTGDLNDFVMHDLLKKTGITLSIPLLITYSDQSERALDQYEKLQYKAEGYFKKPLSREQLSQLLTTYLKPLEDTHEEDLEGLMANEPIAKGIPGIDEVAEEEEYSDDNIDRLMKGDDLDDHGLSFFNGEKDEEESTNPFASGFPETELKLAEDPEKEKTKRKNLKKKLDFDGLEVDLDVDLGLDDDLVTAMPEEEPETPEEPQTPVTPDIPDTPEAPVADAGATDTELAVQLSALEQQNQFLEAREKEILEEMKTLKADADTAGERKQQIEALTARNQELETNNNELSGKLETLRRKVEDERGESGVIQGEMEKLTGQLSGKLEALEQEKSGIEQEKSGLETQLEGLKIRASSAEEEKETLNRKLEEAETEKAAVQQQLEELNNRLTDKEREVVALNHQFEKDLKKKADQLIQQTEDRMQAEFKTREEELLSDMNRFKEEAQGVESGIRGEIESLQTANSQLETQRDELKKREGSLNRTVTTLAEEKVGISEKITSLEEEMAKKISSLEDQLSDRGKEMEEMDAEHREAVERMQKELEEKDALHRKAVDQLGKQLEETLQQANEYKNKVDSMTGLLQNALALTKEEQQK